MVTKAALGAVGVVVIAVLGGGFLLGTLMDDSSAGPGEGTATPTETAAPTPTAAGTATAVAPTATPTAGDQGTQTPTLARRFKVAAVEDNVTQLVNRERGNESLEPLGTDGVIADRLGAMAGEHSVAMADAGRVSPTIDGVTQSERYQEYDVYENCKYSDGVNVYTPERPEKFVALASNAVGDYEDVEGERVYVSDERTAARMLVEKMLADPDMRAALVNEHVSRAGVGAEITRNNEVYVTVALCS
jgi:hypothetical protein